MDWYYKDLIETLVRFKEKFPDCNDYELYMSNLFGNELMIRFTDNDGTKCETTLAVFPSADDYEEE